MDLNKVMIIGRLTKDPELKTIPSGASVCQMGVATGYVYNNRETGQKIESTEFHNVVLWRKLGEIAAQYLKKGQQVYIEGRLQTRSWDGADGQKRYRTEIVADNMIMLGSKTPSTGSGSSSGTYNNSNNAGYQAPSFAKAPNFAKASSDESEGKPAAAPAQDMNQSSPVEEIPTIQQGEDISVEDIPF